MRRDVFQGIADPTRRAILNLLAGRKLTLNEIAEHFSISRPAISKQIKILAECGLVAIHQEGRYRYCEVQPEMLDKVSNWVEKVQQLWEQRFDRLEETLQELKKEANHE